MFTSSAGSSLDLLSKKCFSKSSIGFFFSFSFVPKAIFLEWILLACWYTGSINEAICSSGTFWTYWAALAADCCRYSYGTVQCLGFFALLLLPCLSSLVHSLFHSIVNSFRFWNLVLELHPIAYSIAQLVSQGYCCLLGLPNGAVSVHFEKGNGAARGGR